MKLCVWLFATGVLLSRAGAAPVIATGAAVNTASYALYGLPNSGLAQGSFFTIFGQDLGPAQFTQVSSYPLPPELAGTSVTITIGGAAKNAYILYVSAAQIGAVLPSDTPTGTGTLRLTRNGQSTAEIPIQVVKSAFGMFTANSRGTGPALVFDATGTGVYTIANAIRPKQVITLWGTGLGPVNASTEGSQPPSLVSFDVNSVEVNIGGKGANVLYAGRSPYTGIDQVNVEIPDGVQGCYVPVAVRSGNVTSNFSSIPIAASGTSCSDSILSASDIATARQQQSLRSAVIHVARSVTRTGSSFFAQNITRDSVTATFAKQDYPRLLQAAGIDPAQIAVSTAGSCNAYSVKLPANADLTAMNNGDPVTPDFLNAGSALTLISPSGQQAIPQNNGVYGLNFSGSFAPPGTNETTLFLASGTQTVTGPGSTSVGAFSASTQVNAPLTWNNVDEINIVDRSQDLPITWTGGDPAGFVFVSGFSRTLSGDSVLVAGFVCKEQVAAGRFTVPSLVLMTLPASPFGFPGALRVTAASPPSSFSAQGLDKATIDYSFSIVKAMQYQ